MQTTNIPRAGRIPSDMLALNVIATLAISPSANDDKILRTDRISSLIADALAGK